ncbi:MAG: dihydrofolate reductase [Paludibacteraceae bacterium]|nr:dihydrofolate reductase [Paludibacteraceae bacterium]
MTITLIVAKDLNDGIGKDNQLLCHLSADLKHFKALTTGHTVIMGRKTYDSLPNGALPNRRNIVISHQKGLELANCNVYESLDNAFASCKSTDKVFVIGGASIYAQAIANADFLEITEIGSRFDADVFFPHIDTAIWEEVSREEFAQDDKNPYPYSFVSYKRVKTY